MKPIDWTSLVLTVSVTAVTAVTAVAALGLSACSAPATGPGANTVPEVDHAASVPGPRPPAPAPFVIRRDASPEAAADLIAVNGAIYTVDSKQPWAQAVGIKGTDIVYVGTNEGAHAFVGSETRVADLRGKFVMPGLISTHEHPIMLMGVASGLATPINNDKAVMLAELKKYVASHPKGPYFSFGGSDEGPVGFTRQELDAVIADKPFLMIAGSGHAAWANTKALEMAGVVRGQPDPVGSFQRDVSGTPTGYVQTSAATFYVVAKLGLLTTEAAVARAGGVLASISRLGITAMYDAGQAPGTEDALLPVVGKLETDGKLTVRLSASIMAQRPAHIEGALAKLAEYGPRYSSDLFNVNSFTIHGDGAPDRWTAGMLAPYADKPNSSGPVSFPAEMLKELALKIAKLGYDIHTQARGDRTVRQSLDAYQAVREAGFEGVRLSMGHTQVVQPDDKPRFAKHDITANTHATGIAVPDPAWTERMGPERVLLWAPMQSLVDAGARLTMSADYPTSDLNPWLQMSIAMSRHNPGEAESLPPADDRLAIDEAIRAYTMNAAYQLRWEKQIGSVEVGKRADLIVLDRDITRSTTDEIAGTHVLVTMMNGRLVHEEAVHWDTVAEQQRFDVFEPQAPAE